MISVIIPTLTGREESLKRIVTAYKRTLSKRPHEIIIVKDKETWPTACNEGYAESRGDILHFSADDLEPLPKWYSEVIPWLEEHDELPAPRVFNHSREGVHDNLEDGPDGAVCWFTRVPIMRRDQYERIGPWPEYNYVADIWVSEKARMMFGIQTRLFYSYAFVHHWHQVGRKDDEETMALAWTRLEDLRQEWRARPRARA